MRNSIFYLILQGCAIKFAVARLNMTVTSRSCDAVYDMEVIVEAYVTYDGSRLAHKECYVKFKNYETRTIEICVKPISLKLACSTKVELGFSYTESKTYLSCRNISYDEWCGLEQSFWLDILFRTSSSNADYVKLHVYLKDLPKDDEDNQSTSDTNDSSSAGIAVPFVGLTLLVVGVVFVLVYRRAKRMRATTGHVKDTISAQPITGYQPTQQIQSQPVMEGRYQHCTEQYTYPVPPQSETGQQYYVSYQNISASQTDRNDPPSYEKVTS